MRLTDELGAWVARQRWYAGKSHEPRFRILDAQPAPEATRYLLMDDAGSLPTLYNVPLVHLPATDHPDAVIAHDDGGVLVDAVRHPGFTVGLLAEMGVDVSRVTGSRVLTGEQSNTSIVYDVDGEPTIILKLFRTLHHGENPDVTVQRVLSDAGSPYVPRFYGSLDASWPDVGRASGSASGTLGFAQEFLRGVRDGWAVALDAAREGRDFTDAASDLGRAVAGVHGALGAALETKDAGADEVAATGNAWQRRLSIAASEVPAVAERVDAIRAVYETALARPWPLLQRIHGDLHLGQVLAVPHGGWRIVDFEGEPLRPMAERAIPDLPPRDVAGMLRSFDYAGAVGAGPDASEWAAACRDAFVAAYVEAPGAVALDPVLLRALVLDKAVYESIYEARNRPDWLPVPLAGIDAALA
ncbi:maltokinase N-terminal cap-like domain-containing protein [Microbacterium imperiale]|uniref:Maltokinase n=1 Tax=Microbacterium imperiale TaxID=33884 RepID=A0A9W6M3F0_9MICO|nr:phosphotransferase [Microbacterium imperiale]MBP2420683.1 putative trehalose synthase [Microbacterium imperiale]MDS0200504.1 phosphotransferase [Microbacterium imperiale]BFE41023.1 trehalose biosynthesis protein [Microbacterium imperiale]GLJ80010.1 trehalose biosynthesis protein [Microbacterium imperiale]